MNNEYEFLTQYNKRLKSEAHALKHLTDFLYDLDANIIDPADIQLLKEYALPLRDGVYCTIGNYIYLVKSLYNSQYPYQYVYEMYDSAGNLIDSQTLILSDSILDPLFSISELAFNYDSSIYTDVVVSNLLQLALHCTDTLNLDIVLMSINDLAVQTGKINILQLDAIIDDVTQGNYDDGVAQVKSFAHSSSDTEVTSTSWLEYLFLQYSSKVKGYQSGSLILDYSTDGVNDSFSTSAIAKTFNTIGHFVNEIALFAYKILQGIKTALKWVWDSIVGGNIEYKINDNSISRYLSFPPVASNDFRISDDFAFIGTLDMQDWMVENTLYYLPLKAFDVYYYGQLDDNDNMIVQSNVFINFGIFPTFVSNFLNDNIYIVELNDVITIDIRNNSGFTTMPEAVYDAIKRYRDNVMSTDSYFNLYTQYTQDKYLINTSLSLGVMVYMLMRFNENSFTFSLENGDIQDYPINAINRGYPEESEIKSFLNRFFTKVLGGPATHFHPHFSELELTYIMRWLRHIEDECPKSYYPFTTFPGACIITPAPSFGDLYKWVDNEIIFNPNQMCSTSLLSFPNTTAGTIAGLVVLCAITGVLLKGLTRTFKYYRTRRVIRREIKGREKINTLYDQYNSVLIDPNASSVDKLLAERKYIQATIKYNRRAAARGLRPYDPITQTFLPLSSSSGSAVTNTLATLSSTRSQISLDEIKKLIVD